MTHSGRPRPNIRDSHNGRNGGPTTGGATHYNREDKKKKIRRLREIVRHNPHLRWLINAYLSTPSTPKKNR